MDLERFEKLLNMTASRHDGEALTALRMANSMLKASGKTWQQLLSPPVRIVERIVEQPRPIPVAEMLDQLRHDNCDNDFFMSLYEQFRSKRRLSEKQIACLRRMYDDQGYG